MNQSQWESACKSRGRHIWWAIIGIFCLVPISLAIICNNSDQLAEDSSQKKNDSSNSSFLTFQFTDSLEIEKLSNGDTAHIAESIKKAQKDMVLVKNSLKASADTCSRKAADKTNPAIEKNTKSAIPEKKTVKTEKFDTVTNQVKKSEKRNIIKDNNLHEYSILLPEIHYYAVDRKDIIISLALELFYTDSVYGREILLMRDALNTIALNVLKNKELALLNKDSAAHELEMKMNEIFERKTLSRVMIRDFNIEKATKQ